MSLTVGNAQLDGSVVAVRVEEDRIVALGRLSVRGKESGAEAESSAGWVVDFKNGKMVRVTEYLDRQEALAAAGLAG